MVLTELNLFEQMPHAVLRTRCANDNLNVRLRSFQRVEGLEEKLCYFWLINGWFRCFN